MHLSTMRSLSAAVAAARHRAPRTFFSGPSVTARGLDLSEGTVRNYLSETIGTLGVTNRIEAARLARQRGWL